VCYEAVRDAGLTPNQLSEISTGVFVGAGAVEHLAMQIEHEQHISSHTMSGNTLGNIANRISYAFDWNGPSFTVDTACSSSLTAFHLAVRALEAGDCDTAVVCLFNL
jgi:acyl transferase domain-containing protein